MGTVTRASTTSSTSPTATARPHTTPGTTTHSSGDENVETTNHSAVWVEDVIAALLHDNMDDFYRLVSSVNASDSHMIEELVVACEGMVWDAAAQVDAEKVVHMVTLIGDIASVGLPEDELARYETPTGTVLHVMVPSIDRSSKGFVLGPFTVPPLDDAQQEISVQVISWAKNLFVAHDTSRTMLTINIRKNRENVALTNLDPPLGFTLDVAERISHSDTNTFERSCVFWNASSGNWSDHGLEVVRANLTQVGMVMLSGAFLSAHSIWMQLVLSCPVS